MNPNTELHQLVAALIGRHRRNPMRPGIIRDKVSPQQHWCLAGCKVTVDPTAAGNTADLQFIRHQAKQLIAARLECLGVWSTDTNRAAAVLGQHQASRRTPVKLEGLGEWSYTCRAGCTITTTVGAAVPLEQLFRDHQADMLIGEGFEMHVDLRGEVLAA